MNEGPFSQNENKPEIDFDSQRIEKREILKGKWEKYTKGDAFYNISGDRFSEAAKIFSHTGLLDRRVDTWDSFHVFYPHNADGESVQPAFAFLLKYADSSGLDKNSLKTEILFSPSISDEDITPAVISVIEEKIKEFELSSLNMKNALEDAKTLLKIKQETETGRQLSNEDLSFLYCLNRPIEWFHKIVRVDTSGVEHQSILSETYNKIRNVRDLDKDILTIFDCEPEEIARDESEISEKTKIYIGKLFPGIFNKNIEHIFTSFPDGKIKRFKVYVGTKSERELRDMMRKEGIDPYLVNHIVNPETKRGETVNIVVVDSQDLGFSGGKQLREIYQEASKLGLKPCPQNTGPYFRLSYPGKDEIHIATENFGDGRLLVSSKISNYVPVLTETVVGSYGEHEKYGKFAFCV